MSFQMLKSKIIDVGLCQGCGLCEGLCKHIKFEGFKPELKDYCVLDREGVECGKCYNSCPQVIQKKFEPRIPKGIYSLRTKDPEIQKNASSGGFVTTIVKKLLEKNELTNVVLVQNDNEIPRAISTSKVEDVIQSAGSIYGRPNVLSKLIQTLENPLEKIGIVGVPCEMRGVSNIQNLLNKDILKIGLFCNAGMRSFKTDQGIMCSPCCSGCPADVDARGYIDLIRQSKFKDAMDLIRKNNPLPSVCGQICTNECEHNCTLMGVESPIAIRELKKNAANWEINNTTKYDKSSKNKGEKIAIIGSGASGLTAAYFLAKMGYSPTIFEKSSRIGGMLRYGVPEFRLTQEFLEHDIQVIKNAGVEILTNTTIGSKLTISDLKKEGYKAFFVGIGLQNGFSMSIEGNDLKNVFEGVDFLKMVKKSEESKKIMSNLVKDKIVGVVGGGDVAMDSARTAVRLGAKKVIILYRRSEDQMPASDEEIEMVKRENIEFKFLTNPVCIIGDENGCCSELECVEMDLGKPDSSGRPQPIVIENSEFKLNIDVLIQAIGQTVDFSELDAATDNKLQKDRGRLVVNEITFESNVPGIFAAGDMIQNSKGVVISAVAQAKEAALSIDRYLKGKDLEKGRVKQSKLFSYGPKRIPKFRAPKPEHQEPVSEDFLNNFKQIEGMFNEERAISEAQRCLNCNNYCSHCQDFPASHADLAAGDIGSKKGYTTVIAWTEKGKEIVETAIKKGLFEIGSINEEKIQSAINIKSKRELLRFETTPRQKILDYVNLEGPLTITKISENLAMEPKKVRYEALRLVQQQKLNMKIAPALEEPVFSAICD
ncbi:MAG: FAD-dependent oxidoreductase [Candidatus Lokiarchaeota archaeon]|nr:FAD-dependent oxidoreductase [Candidatus Lokiarchaeota archaeon]